MIKLLNKKRKLFDKKGFSLVELIIVIAIMAVLVAILAPQYLKYVENSKVAADNSAADELLTAIKVALTDETIYSAVDGGDTVTWNANEDAIAVNSDAGLLAEIQSTLGLGTGTTIEVKSKTYGDQIYTITITEGADNSLTATGIWSAAPAA